MNELGILVIKAQLITHLLSITKFKSGKGYLLLELEHVLDEIDNSVDDRIMKLKRVEINLEYLKKRSA